MSVPAKTDISVRLNLKLPQIPQEYMCVAGHQMPHKLQTGPRSKDELLFSPHAHLCQQETGDNLTFHLNMEAMPPKRLRT